MHETGTAAVEAEHGLQTSASAAMEIRWEDAHESAVADNSSDAFDVEIASGVECLDAIASDWMALESLSPAAAIFQSYAHIRTWARHFVEGGGARLDVAIVRANGRPVLLLPTVSSNFPGLRIARLAGDPIGQYSDILADPSLASRAAFKAALDGLRKRGTSAVTFRRVRDDSALLRLASRHLRPPVARKMAPYESLAGVAGFAAYYQTLSKKMRQGLRNRHHHLERAGEHRFEILRGAEARASVAEAMNLKREWMVQRGNVSTAFVDPATRACLLDLAGNGATGAVVMRLTVGEEVAAIRYGFDYRGTHFAYLSAYDSKFAALSPGKLLMEYCFSGFRERGIERIDMLPPAGSHKEDWCRDAMGVADYTLPLTRAGRAYVEVYQERVRPALRTAFDSMPASVRSLVATLLIHI